MARSHARTVTTIWDDSDFLALSGHAQRCYWMLMSQPNLGHAGVLSTTVRRWTLLCADETEDRLRSALGELAAARFIVIDDRTEELLIRSLIRNDGAWKQPKVLAVAISEAASIRSPLLRACVAEELARIDVTSLGDKTRPDVEALLKDLPARLACARAELREAPSSQAPPGPPADPPPQAPPRPPREHPGEAPCEARRDPPPEGDPGGARAHAGASPAPAPSPAGQPPAAAGKPRPDGQPLTDTQRSKPITDAYARAEPLCRWPAVNGIVLKAIRTGQYADHEIRDALLRLAAEGRTVTTDTLRIELAGFPPARQRAPAGRARHQPYRNPDDDSVYQEPI